MALFFSKLLKFLIAVFEVNNRQMDCLIILFLFRNRKEILRKIYFWMDKKKNCRYKKWKKKDMC